MNLLLDTSVLLWWFANSPRLKQGSREAIAASPLVYVSAASVWEIEIKRALGKLEAPDNLEEALSASYFVSLPITVPHAIAAARLPRHHDDPFDRMLVAQAAIESLILVTSDTRLADYGGEIQFV